jgi:hypothetical protein
VYEVCSRVMEGRVKRMEGGKRNHLSYTSSPGEMPNQQSKNRLAYNYRTLTHVMCSPTITYPTQQHYVRKLINLLIFIANQIHVSYQP